MTPPNPVLLCGCENEGECGCECECDIEYDIRLGRRRVQLRVGLLMQERLLHVLLRAQVGAQARRGSGGGGGQGVRTPTHTVVGAAVARGLAVPGGPRAGLPQAGGWQAAAGKHTYLRQPHGRRQLRRAHRLCRTEREQQRRERRRHARVHDDARDVRVEVHHALGRAPAQQPGRLEGRVVRAVLLRSVGVDLGHVLVAQRVVRPALTAARPPPFGRPQQAPNPQPLLGRKPTSHRPEHLSRKKQLLLSLAPALPPRPAHCPAGS
jgi:hypothetical protein